MHRLLKLAEENELTLQDIINEKGKEVVDKCILSLYEAYCLDEETWGYCNQEFIENVSASNVLELIEDRPDDIITWISDNLGYDSETFPDISDEVIAYFEKNLFNKFEIDFEEFKEKYFKNHNIYNNTYDNTFDNTYDNTYDNYHNNTNDNTNNEETDNRRTEDDEGIEDTTELLNLDDNVGDTIDLNESFGIDFPEREAPFVYMDGEIIIGNSEDSHTKLINTWCEDNDIDPMQERWTRQSPDKVMKVVNKDNVGFGHIDKDMAVIETCVGCTKEDVLQALKECGRSFKKIYFWSRSSGTVTRLAKKHKLNIRNEYYMNIYNKIIKGGK